ncbi:MAG: cell division protein FtsA [Oligoflexia bacterium]|nr:cell division protein FtsA [Oligoflexia bacterium]
MANKANVLVGLDIGTTNVTVALGEVFPDGRVDVIGVGTSPSRGLRKGVVINIEGTVQSIAAAVQQAETMAGVEVGAVYAAISGNHIKGFNSHGIVGIKRKEVSQLDIEKVIEAAKAVAIPLDREVLHVLPQEFIIDEQDGIREPLGMSGVRLEARVHIVTGAVASAQNIVKCANRCGLSVQNIVLAPIVSARAVLAPEEQELGVCLVDIGGGTTDLVVFHNGAVKHTSVIAVGGNHITNDIAAGLRTPLAAAEEIKCRHGSALVSLVRDDDTIEVPSTGGRAPRVLSKPVLAEIIEPRVQEILSMVHKELVKAECEEYLTSGLVLTGGTAGMHGIAQAAEQIFSLPVRVGYPVGVSGLSDLVRGPEYATAVGLLLFGAQDAARGKHSHGSHRVGRAFKRVGNWFAEHF